MPELDAHKRYQEQKGKAKPNKPKYGPPQDYNKLMIQAAAKNYGKFTDRYAHNPSGRQDWKINRKFIPKRDQQKLDALDRNPNKQDVTGIEQWRESEFNLQFDPQNEWNGQQITGLRGEKLPDGALGFDWNGDPIFEKGVDGWWKRMNYKMHSGDDAELWAEKNPEGVIKIPWVAGIAGQVFGEEVGEKVDKAITFESVSPYWHDIKSWYYTGGGPTSVATRTVGSFFGSTVGEFMVSASESAQRLMSMADAAGDEYKRQMEAQGKGMMDVKPGFKGNWTFGGFAVDPEVHKDAVDAINKTQLSANQNLTSGKIDWGKVWEEGLAGHQVGSRYVSHLYDNFVSDGAMRKTAMDEYKSGVDPRIIAQKYVHQGAQFFGDWFLDPLNLIGGVGVVDNMSKQSRLMNVATDVEKALADTPGIFGKTRLANQSQQLTDVVKAVGAAVADRKNNLQKLADDYGVRQLSKQGKVATGIETVNTFTNHIAGEILRAGGSHEDVIEGMTSIWKIGSGKSDDIIEGYDTLAKLTNYGVSKSMFSDDAFDAAAIMRKMWDDPKDALKLLEGSGGDVEKVLTALDKKVAGALDDFYPSVAEHVQAMEQAGKHVPAYMKAGVKFEKATKPIYNAMNWYQGTVYLKWSPGYAMKNLWANTFQMAVDNGVWPTMSGYTREIWRKAKGIDSNAEIRKMLGNIPGDPYAVKGGIGGASAMISGKADEIKFLQGPAGYIANKFEDVGSRITFEHTVRKSLDNDLKGGRVLETVEDMLANRGIPAEMGQAYNKLVQNHYSHERAMEILTEANKNGGKLDDFKNGLWLNERDTSIAKDFDVHDDLMDIAENATSKEDAISQMEDMQKRIDGFAKRTRQDPAAMQIDGLATEIYSEYLENMDVAQEAAQQITWAGQANNIAMDRINDAAWQLHAVDPGNPVWFKPVTPGSRMTNSDFLRTPQIKSKYVQETRDLTTRARHATWELNSRNFTRDDMARIWDEFGFEGTLPDNMTAKELKSKIWNDTFEQTAQKYQALREAQHEVLGRVAADINPSDKRKLMAADAAVEHARNWDRVQQGQLYADKAYAYQKAGDWNMVGKTLLEKYGLANKGRGNVNYLANMYNKYVARLDDAIDDITVDDILSGKMKWSDFDEALGQRLVQGSGLNQDWDIAQQISELTPAKINDVLGESQLWYKVAERNGAYRLQVHSDAGRPIFVTDDWVASADEALEGGVKNILDDAYVARKSDKGAGLLERQKEWRSQFGIEKGKVAGEADQVAVRAAGEAEEAGFKLTYEWQEVPEGIEIPAIPGIRSEVIDGKLMTRINPEVKNAKALRDDLPAIPYDGEFPSLPRVYQEQLHELNRWMDEVGVKMQDSYGKTRPVVFNRDVNNAFQTMGKEVNSRLADARYLASKRGNVAKQFTLLDYSKRRNFDTILGKVYPFHFWYSRTYANWVKRIAQNPRYLARYYRYKKTLNEMHAGMPPWWKGNISTDDLGINLENPIFLNLEATLSPVYGITGVNFEDRDKRLNGFTTAIDEMGSFGPTIHSPFTWALAAGLYLQGEEEAAAKWGGRLFPQTRVLKAGLTKLGVNIDTPGGGINEFDPFVHLFSDGIDPFERKRVGRYAATWLEDRPQDRAAVESALYRQEGELWNELVIGAQNLRAGADLSSFFLGAGFKGRTVQDMQIDMMDQERTRMWALAQTKDNDWLQNEMARLQEKYPWMDTVVLSRKTGFERDRSYAYSVLGRIPPSQSDDLFKSMGLPKEYLNKFYDTGGRFTDWTPEDKDTFMDFVVTAGAVLDFPDDATRDEWDYAVSYKKRIEGQMQSQFGQDILTRINEYWEVVKEGDRTTQDMYLKENPEVEMALSWKDNMMLNDPIASAYYMSLDKTERYYTSMLYDIKQQEFPGVDFKELWAGYWEARMYDDENGTKTAKEYWKEHPELEYASSIQERLEEYTSKAYARAGKQLGSPQWPDPQEKGFDEETGLGEQRILDFVNSQGTAQQGTEFEYSWDQWQSVLESSHLSNVVADYARGTDIPDVAFEQLERKADRLDMSVYTMLELMADSIDQDYPVY